MSSAIVRRGRKKVAKSTKEIVVDTADEIDYYLPSEIWSVIGSFLPTKSKLHLALCSKHHWNAMTFYKVYGGKYGTIQLSLEQQSILEEMNDAKTPHIAVKAPPGTGKTAITVAHLLDSWSRDPDRLTLITAPSNCVSLWPNEINKISPTLINKNNPEESKILIYHVSYPKHLEYLKERLYNHTLHSKVLGVICSHVIATKVLNSVVFDDQISKFNRIIVDECHLTDLWTMACTSSGSFSRTQNGVAQALSYLGIIIPTSVVLSATRTDKGRYYISKNQTTYIEREHKIIEKIVPDYKTITPIVKLDKLLPELLEKHDKLVIFITSKNKKGQIEKISSYLKKDTKLFKFAGNISTIEKFHKIDAKAVLLFTYANGNVGHTINCDCVVLADADNVRDKLLHQTKARFLRLTNRAKEVVYYEVTDNPLLAKFVRIMADMKRKTPPIYNATSNQYNRLKSGLVEKVAEILGINLFELSDDEFIHFVFPTSTIKLNKETFKAKGMLDLPYREQLITLYKS